MQEKIHQGLLRDKKDLEKRVADILGKMDEQGQKFREDHHQTVRYFESQMAVMRVAE
jgi:hypothetical protein